MPYGMYISAEGAKVQSQRLDVIANNLANVNTVGFKRDVTSFQARFSQAIQQGLAQSGDGSINNVGGGVKVAETQTDYSTGRLQHTGQAHDLAIVSKGFFQVRTENGEVLLTRAGNFHKRSDGMLVTESTNNLVLDQRGREILLLPNEPFEVSGDGVFTQDGSARVLGLMKPRSQADLVKVGSNEFRPLAAPVPVPVEERVVRQGYLEMSGSEPTRQMMDMIETSRAFEANTRMVQNQDSMTSSLVSRVLQS